MRTTTTIERDDTPTGSDPVPQLYGVERRLSRIYSVVRSLTALASHENEPPPTIYLTEALELLDEQLKVAVEDLQEAISHLGQSEDGQ